mmetsp:Transcript_21170/g.21294  ORF Transcript_21170/g.21294 Transcript_21170/m.21294 type:complete len:155 (-) Transcript_21170:54-518(-)
MLKRLHQEMLKNGPASPLGRLDLCTRQHPRPLSFLNRMLSKPVENTAIDLEPMPIPWSERHQGSGQSMIASTTTATPTTQQRNSFIFANIFDPTNKPSSLKNTFNHQRKDVEGLLGEEDINRHEEDADDDDDHDHDPSLIRPLHKSDIDIVTCV